MADHDTTTSVDLPAAMIQISWLSQEKDRPPGNPGFRPCGFFVPLPCSTLSLLCLLFILFAGQSFAASEHSTKHVLVLNSYHLGYSWSDTIMAGIREGFSDTPLQITKDIEYMDTKRHAVRDVFPVFEELLKIKYRTKKPDVIIVSDDNALDFLLSRRARLFPDIPVVFCGINNFTDEMIKGQGQITGISEEHGYRQTLALVRRLHPGKTTFVAVSDITESGIMNLEKFREAAGTLDEKIERVELAGLKMADLARRLGELPEDAVLFHIDYYLDPDGRTFTDAESFALLRANSRLPIYVNTDNKIGFGAVGGIVATGRLQGLTAARMALGILKGQAAETIPIMRTAPARPVFDYEILRQYNIPLRLLPADSKVINRPVSFYTLYEKYIWIAALLISVQSLLIFFLLRNIRLRKRTARGLLESEHFIAALFDNISEAIVSCDAQGKTARFNQAARELHGLPAKPIPADEWAAYYDLFEVDGQTILAKERIPLYRAYLGETVRNAELVVKPRKGSPVRLVANGAPLFDEQGDLAGAVVSMHDITAQVRILNELRDANEELRTVNRIIATTTTATEVQEILEIVLDQALAVTGLEGGTICMVTEDDTLHLAAHRATSAATIEDLTTNTVRVGECLCGECARDHRPLVLHDREEVLAFATREATRGEDICFHAAFPLVAAGKCLGVLCVFTRTGARPSERGLKLLESISAQIAMAVRDAQLHEETVQLANTLEDKIRARTRELEEKISEIERMSRLFVGRELKMAELKKKISELETAVNGSAP